MEEFWIFLPWPVYLTVHNPLSKGDFCRVTRNFPTGPEGISPIGIELPLFSDRQEATQGKGKQSETEFFHGRTEPMGI